MIRSERLGLLALLLASLSLGTSSCRQGDAGPASTAPTTPLRAVAAPPATSPATMPAFAAVPDQAHLPNAHFVTAKVISGAQPEGDEAFRLLQRMGVKT